MEEELLALLAPLLCHWGGAPQGSRRPFVVLRLVSQPRPVTQEGLRPGTVRSRVQADCYGETYFGGLELARDLIDRVEGRRVGRFQGIFVAGVRDLTGPDDIGTGVAHRRAVDLLINHTA